jgi:hypothetical protein
VTRIHLIDSNGALGSTELLAAPDYVRPSFPLTSRLVYAAAHVVPKPWADNVPGAPADIDWDATLAFRHHLWSWGLGVADAMDTAQRNMGLDWAATAELIRRSAGEARSVGGGLVVGVNTDHVSDEFISLNEVVAAYRHQLEVAEDAGAGVVLMASRHLARVAEKAGDYERVYREVLDASQSPVVLHWLGEAFDATLAGYWGSSHVTTATDTVLRIIREHNDRITGIKMSLLNADYEVALRDQLPEGVRMFTGDDFNYVGLVEGDGDAHSDALLGAFAALGPSASAAIQALDRHDTTDYRRILGPTEALARHGFSSPTQFYKTGVAFLSWLNGHQTAFAMVGGLHSARSLPHLSEIVRLANEVGALEQPDLAAERWHGILAVNGLV